MKTIRVDFSADKYEPGLRKYRHCTEDNDIGRDDRTVRHGNNHCRVYPARIITRSVRTRGGQRPRVRNVTPTIASPRYRYAKVILRRAITAGYIAEVLQIVDRYSRARLARSALNVTGRFLSPR